MWKSLAAAAAFVASTVGVGAGLAQVDPNAAMNNPDKQAWDLFLTVNASAASTTNNNALFETWARDDDTFRPKPTWPTSPAVAPKTGARALGEAGLAQPATTRPGFKVQVVPVDVNEPVGEETRRNRQDFDFIVQNNLFKVSGLKAAFTAGKPISFPVDSIEVKANWVDVTKLRTFNGFTGTPAQAAAIYHVNTASDGKQYALVSFHIISKLVPNWTWATFEHKDNLGRCDVMGCLDSYGAKTAFVKPASLVELDAGNRYADCMKSPALVAAYTRAKIDPAFKNYCLKGSQSDFSDPTGLAFRVGNSVTEKGFVAQASCMSCHGRAVFDSTGKPTTLAGFDIFTPNLPLNGKNAGSAPIGHLKPSWYWALPGPPFTPAVSDRQADALRIAMPADFVWSIPFCAIDDTANPAQTQSRCFKK